MPRLPFIKPLSHFARQRVRSAWLFMAPTLCVLFLAAGWPLLRTIWFSFTDAHLNRLSQKSWVGLDNYIQLIQDDLWWQAVQNTAFFAFVSVGLETIFGLIIALILNAHFKGRGWLRAAVLVPWAIPTVVSARMWGWMYHDIYGVINALFLKLHIISAPLAWTADPEIAMWAVIMVDVWKTTPFMALLLLAGLQMLPQECYEAAKVDGIHPIRVFYRVTLPLLKPALLVAVIFRLLDAFRVFDIIYVLTSNTDETMSMSVYARQQLFDFQEIGFGSSASTFLFLLIAAFSVLYMVMSGTFKEEHR